MTEENDCGIRIPKEDFISNILAVIFFKLQT
jgi:hypothetical protein